MVNLTTASLEPAPLSSGWKSGSLPTGFTPTILTESPGGAGATLPASEVKAKKRPGRQRRAPRLLPGLSVPSHARQPSGRGGGDPGGERPEQAWRAAPGSPRAAGP